MYVLTNLQCEKQVNLCAYQLYVHLKEHKHTQIHYCTFFVVWVKYCTYIYISIYIICEHTLDTHIEITSDLFSSRSHAPLEVEGGSLHCRACQLFAWMPWVCVIVVHPSLDVWNYAEVFVVSRWPPGTHTCKHTHTQLIRTLYIHIIIIP